MSTLRVESVIYTNGTIQLPAFESIAVIYISEVGFLQQKQAVVSFVQMADSTVQRFARNVLQPQQSADNVEPR